MHALANAAREMIASTLERIQVRNAGQDDEDLVSLLRQQKAIETEIKQLETLFSAAQKIAKMKYPSVEEILRERGFGYEADRIAKLVVAAEYMTIKNDAD